MTNPLILQLQIEETKLNKEQSELKIKIGRLVNELSVYVATYYGDFEGIDAQRIEQIGDELLETKIKTKEIGEKLEAIRKQLGR